MGKVRLCFYWFTLSIAVLFVHILLVYDDAYAEFVSAYIFGLGFALTVLALAFSYMDRTARQRDYVFFWTVVKTVLREIWYWVLGILIIVFVFNFLRSLIQLFVERENISQKVLIYSDPFMGQMFVMILSFIFGAFFIRLLYKKIKRM